MALTECKECGGKVSTSADFCPHCGYKEKPAAKEEEQPKKQAEYQGSTCSNCGHPMSQSAKKCEHCGKENSTTIFFMWFILILFFFVFMGIINLITE